MEHATADAAARAQWLDTLLDLDDAARDAALNAADVPEEWRRTGARLCALGTADGILDRDPGAIADRVLGAVARPPAPKAGACAGRYRLERIIGEGGMATVWLARHQDPRLPQQVAVKCLHTMLSTPEWRDRFLREQRILAKLHHPNVTRLYDAGITDEGTPYIVMEHIDGEPITSFCDWRRLACKDRVRLFLKVCASVAHAHRSLIVHRDLKPRNVLVSDDGEPHLLDFGIAKLLDPTEQDAETTRTGLALLTPAYAAPEQFSHAPITTATDVYGLGAMLHELLTGTRARHHADGRLQLPSSRIADTAGTIRGGISGAALRRTLRGDLDAILERALRREPELRYASAAELGDDLERWLAGTVVVAREGNWRYRANKFVRRHWLVLGIVAITVGGLTATTAISVRESARADRAAQQALRDAERAKTVSNFVFTLLRDMRPGGLFDSPHALLDRAALLARDRLPTDLDTRIELLTAIGELQRSYGRNKESQQLLEEIAVLARRHSGTTSAAWLEAEAQLGHTMFRLAEYDAGERRLSQALRIYDADGGRPGAARARALINLGQLRAKLSAKQDDALELQREAYDYVRRELPVDHPLQLTVLEMYGEALTERGRYAQARPVLRENLALARRRLGDGTLEFVSALETMAVFELSAGDPAAALTLAEEGRRIATSLLRGQPHVTAAYVENTLGVAELRLGRVERAEAAFARALQIFEALYDAPHAMLIATRGNLAEAAIEQQRYVAAAAQFDEIARQRVQRKEPDAGPRCQAAEARAHAGKRREGIASMQRCVDDLYQDPRTDYTGEYLGGALGALADAQWLAGDRTGAARTAREALALPPSGVTHIRLQPLLVLMRATEDAGMATQHALTALQALDDADVVRPCQTRRLLVDMAQRVGDLHDGDSAARLRQRARLIACEGAAELPDA